MRCFLLLLVCIIAYIHAMPVDLRENSLADHAKTSSLYVEERELLTAARANFTFGVDVSKLHSVDVLRCAVRDMGARFFIPRGYRSSCSVDPNVVENIKNGWASGMLYVDVYMFPAPRCAKSAAQQVKELYDELEAAGVTYGVFWLDIEAASDFWFEDKRQNQKFLEEMLTSCKDLSLKAGIYVSHNSFDEILGLDYHVPGNTETYSWPLWYPRYQKPADPSMSDWRPYGGFLKPNIKQYAGTTTICETGSVDLNAA